MTISSFSYCQHLKTFTYLTQRHHPSFFSYPLSLSTCLPSPNILALFSSLLIFSSPLVLLAPPPHPFFSYFPLSLTFIISIFHFPIFLPSFLPSHLPSPPHLLSSFLVRTWLIYLQFQRKFLLKSVNLSILSNSFWVAYPLPPVLCCRDRISGSWCRQILQFFISIL